MTTSSGFPTRFEMTPAIVYLESQLDDPDFSQFFKSRNIYRRRMIELIDDVPDERFWGYDAYNSAELTTSQPPPPEEEAA